MKIRIKVNGDAELEIDDTPPPMPELKSLGLADLISPSVNSSDERRAYDKRMGILAEHHLTVCSADDATWIIDRIKDRVAGKTVVEIGAGTGHLAVALAAHAKHVYAFEVDVRWSMEFVNALYKTKPKNLTWIFDRAESMVGRIQGDVAIVVTGSDVAWLRDVAKSYAPEVIMPWQDWNDGRARISLPADVSIGCGG